MEPVLPRRYEFHEEGPRRSASAAHHALREPPAVNRLMDECGPQTLGGKSFADEFWPATVVQNVLPTCKKEGSIVLGVGCQVPDKRAGRRFLLFCFRQSVSSLACSIIVRASAQCCASRAISSRCQNMSSHGISSVGSRNALSVEWLIMRKAIGR